MEKCNTCKNYEPTETEWRWTVDKIECPRCKRSRYQFSRPFRGQYQVICWETECNHVWLTNSVDCHDEVVQPYRPLESAISAAEKWEKEQAINKALLEALKIWEERAKKGVMDARYCPLCLVLRPTHTESCEGCPLETDNQCCPEWYDGLVNSWTPARINAMRDRLRRECEKRGLIEKPMATCNWCLGPTEVGKMRWQHFDDGEKYCMHECDNCRADNQALLDSLKHWQENVVLFEKEKPGDSNEWFTAHCLSNNCACCKRLRMNCLGCMLNGHPGCCGGAWNKAEHFAAENALTVAHLAAVRDYIRQVCVDRGLVAKEESVVIRIAEAVNEYRSKNDGEPDTLELGQKEVKEFLSRYGWLMRIRVKVPGGTFLYDGMTVKCVDADSHIEVYRDYIRCIRPEGPKLKQKCKADCKHFQKKVCVRANETIRVGWACIGKYEPKKYIIISTPLHYGKTSFYEKMVEAEKPKGVCLPQCAHFYRGKDYCFDKCFLGDEWVSTKIGEACHHGKGFDVRAVSE